MNFQAQTTPAGPLFLPGLAHKETTTPSIVPPRHRPVISRFPLTEFTTATGTHSLANRDIPPLNPLLFLATMARSMVVVRFSITTSSDVLAKSRPATATAWHACMHGEVQHDQAKVPEEGVREFPNQPTSTLFSCLHTLYSRASPWEKHKCVAGWGCWDTTKGLCKTTTLFPWNVPHHPLTSTIHRCKDRSRCGIFRRTCMVCYIGPPRFDTTAVSHTEWRGCKLHANNSPKGQGTRNTTDDLYDGKA